MSLESALVAAEDYKSENEKKSANAKWAYQTSVAHAMYRGYISCW